MYFVVFLQDFHPCCCDARLVFFPLVLMFHCHTAGCGLLMFCIFVVVWFVSGLTDVAALKSPSSG